MSHPAHRIGTLRQGRGLPKAVPRVLIMMLPMILWNLHERLNNLLWDRYEKEFLDWVMEGNERKEMDRIMEEELDRLLESEF